MLIKVEIEFMLISFCERDQKMKLIENLINLQLISIK